MQVSSPVAQQVLKNVTSQFHKTASEIELESKQVEAAKSDPAAFKDIYQKYHEQVFRYAYQRTGDKEISFDITSQIFLKVLTNLNKYKSRGLPFGSWLFRIARMRFINCFATTKRSAP